MLGSWYLWWCQLTCTSQNFLEVPNLIWAIVGLAGTSNDQVGPTSVQTLLRPVETWTRDLLGVSCDVWHQGGWVLWGCEVLELPGPNVSQQNIPLWGGLSMFLLSESVVYCCDSSVFISVVLPACFHCPKVAKESKMFRFWYESCKSTKLCQRTAFIRGPVILLRLVVVEEVMCKFSVPVRGPAGAFMCRFSDEEFGGKQAPITLLVWQKFYFWILNFEEMCSWITGV